MHTNQDTDDLFRGTPRAIPERTKTVAMRVAGAALTLIINSLRKK